MERNDAGQYTKQFPEEEVLEVFESAPLPVLTSTEVAESLGCSRGTARNRLEALAESDQLHRKKVGARGVVYVRLEAEGGRLSGYGKWKNSLWSRD